MQQWLRFRTSSAGGTGSILGQGTKVLLPWRGQQKKYDSENREIAFAV